MGEGNSFSLFTFRGGGVPDPILDRGVPRSQVFGGGTQSQISGGVPGLRFQGGVTWSQIFRVVPGLSKGKNF